jgi:hypothetical protein
MKTTSGNLIKISHRLLPGANNLNEDGLGLALRRSLPIEGASPAL